MIIADDLRGKLFPAVPVPFGSDGRVDGAAQERYVAHLASQPMGGVAVWAHTGRGLRLSDAQRAEVLTAWRRGLPGDRLVIASAGAPPQERDPERVIGSAAAMARRAAGLGADALLVHPPVAFRGRADQDRLVLRYHAAVAEAGLPLVLFFLYEAAGGIAYGPQLLAELLARPEVLGIKVATLDGVMTFQQVARLVRTHAPEKLLITGEDRFLGYSLMAGAGAALIGLGAACTALQDAFLQGYWSGAADRFLALNGPVDDLAQHTFLAPMEGYIQRMLWCLVHQGVIPAEAAHDPWGPRLGTAEFDQIGACLARLPRV
ncbi:MAG: 4-hydroxy-tetrahydrodipicolinate synthase [Chloroflexota bacterium]|nr:4-hydroxy-tetrahydrodipicolinate synthase [Chloroflexota bacterium]